MSRYAQCALQQVKLSLDEETELQIKKLFSVMKALDRHLQAKLPTLQLEIRRSDEALLWEGVEHVKALRELEEYQYLAPVSMAWLESQVFVSIRKWRRQTWWKSQGRVSVEPQYELDECWLCIGEEIDLQDGVLRLPGIDTEIRLMVPEQKRTFEGYPKIVRLYQWRSSQGGHQDIQLEILRERYVSFPDPLQDPAVVAWGAHVCANLMRDRTRVSRQYTGSYRHHREELRFHEQRAYEYRLKILNKLRGQKQVRLQELPQPDHVVAP